jgi:hypothetical protein
LAVDKPADDAEAVGDPYKTLFISRLVGVVQLLYLTQTYTSYSTKVQRKVTYAANSKPMALSNELE